MDDYALVDDNGNPVATTSAASVGAAVLVDDNGMPLTHGDFLNRYGQTVKRYPGDPISKIEVRKRNPPPNARGSVTPPKDDGGALDYAATIAENVGGMLPDVTGGGTDPFAVVQHSVQAGQRAARYMSEHPGVAGKTQAVVSAVPVVGQPLADVAGPAISYAEGRAPTHEENVAAVGGGTALAALAATPAVLRRINIMRARGVPEAQIAAETQQSAAPDLTDGQIDRLREATQLGNQMAAVPTKLAEAVNSGQLAPDNASLRDFLTQNPDVAAEVKQSYAVPEAQASEPIAAPQEFPDEAPEDADMAAAALQRLGGGSAAAAMRQLVADDEYRTSPQAALDREHLPIDEFIQQRFPRASVNTEATPEWVKGILAEVPEGKPGLSTENAPAESGVDQRVVYRDPEGRPVAVANIIVGGDAESAPLVRDLATDKSQGMLSARAIGAVATELDRMGVREHYRQISEDAARFVQKAEAAKARKALGVAETPKEPPRGGGDDEGGAAPPSGGTPPPPSTPPPAGTVRFYHGGAPYDWGPRWVSQSLDYARGYANKNPERATVQYVDIPEDSPLLQKSFDDTGSSVKSPYMNFEAPEQIARGLKPFVEAPTRSDFGSPIPTPSDVATIARKAAPLKEIMDGIAPASASPEAATAADILRKSKAEIANDATIERVRNKEIAQQFDRNSDDENVANISAYERTGQFADAPSGYSEMYRETTDAAHESLRETYGDDRVGYVDNYVRRAFKFGSTADEAKATSVLSNWIGSLSASKSPLKGRTLGVPLDDALATMRNAGIEVRMATTNPELLRQWTVENANQARVYKQAWGDAEESKLIQFVRQGDRVPQGLVELNDRVAKVFRPTGQGMVQTGRWFAEPGVARIFNNAISKGLGGSPTFRAIRALNNSYNQMQLGLSAFHLTGTAINAGISDLSLGLQQLLGGEVGEAAKSIGRSAVPALSFARDLYHGRSFINALVSDDPVARTVLEEKLNPAGGRLAVDQSYRNTAARNMVDAWSNGRYLRALGNAPLAVVQKIASPLMDYAIPRVKLGAFLDIADASRQKLPLDASPAQIQRAYEQAWDSIDNRFGQLVHDNLFWNRTAADLAQVGTRSVGWNLGTLREIGGAMVDALRGKVTPRVLYSFSLPVYAGLIGAIYMYLHTGQMPSTVRDYYYPPNGLKDSKGRADRVALPTYMKDLFAYSDHPVTTLEHKASPLVSLAFDLGTNRDYFGDMIRNPDDSASRQWMQNGTYALRQFQPFSIQQASKTLEEGGPLYAGEQFMGFVKAPAEMKMTEEQSDAARERRRMINDEKMRRAAEKHGR